VPESKRRKRPAYTAPGGSRDGSADGAAGSAAPVRQGPRPTPRWWVPVMLGLMIAGLVWIVVFYLSGSAQLPVQQIGAWNLAVGGGLILVGFVMTTRWR
jgi:hypothetical protein